MQYVLTPSSRACSSAEAKPNRRKRSRRVSSCNGTFIRHHCSVRRERKTKRIREKEREKGKKKGGKRESEKERERKGGERNEGRKKNGERVSAIGKVESLFRPILSLSLSLFRLLSLSHSLRLFVYPLRPHNYIPELRAHQAAQR